MKTQTKDHDFWVSGWKGLANYIDFSIKTCRRMVRDGLPMHRARSKRPMFKASEIDSWIKNVKRD